MRVKDDLGDRMRRHANEYEQLLDFISEHPESATIRRALD